MTLTEETLEARRSQRNAYMREYYARTHRKTPRMEKHVRTDVGLKPTTDYYWTKVKRQLRARFGEVESHPCKDCGESSRMWSYTYQDIGNEWFTVASHRGGGGLIFSTDLAFYDTRCLVCHRRHVKFWEDWLGLVTWSSSADPLAS